MALRDIYVTISGEQRYDGVASSDRAVRIKVAVNSDDRGTGGLFADLSVQVGTVYDGDGNVAGKTWKLVDGLTVLKTYHIEYRNGKELEKITTYGDF